VRAALDERVFDGNVLWCWNSLRSRALTFLTCNCSAAAIVWYWLECLPNPISHGFVEDSRQLALHPASPNSSCRSLGNYPTSFSSDPRCRLSEYVLSHPRETAVTG
jgi:hypothetical protein